MPLLGIQQRKRPWKPSAVPDPQKTECFDFDYVQDVDQPGIKKKRKPVKIALDFTLHPLGVFPFVQNIVATFSLDTKLDLDFLVQRMRNVEYNKRKISAIVMRRRNPKTTALIFESGKVVVTGARSEFESKMAARKFARCVQRVYPNVKCKDYHIENVVSNFEAPFAVNLNLIVEQNELDASYEPEIFPGLKYQMQEPKCMCLVFVAGKVVITGLKSTDDIKTAFENIYAVLERAKVKSLPFWSVFQTSMQTVLSRK